MTEMTMDDEGIGRSLIFAGEEYMTETEEQRAMSDTGRRNPEALAELEATGSDEWSTEQIILLLKSRSCPPREPWVGDDWRDDHGHGDCWMHGLAARKLEELQSLVDQSKPVAAKESRPADTTPN